MAGLENLSSRMLGCVGSCPKFAPAMIVLLPFLGRMSGRCATTPTCMVHMASMVTLACVTPQGPTQTRLSAFEVRMTGPQRANSEMVGLLNPREALR